MLAVPVAAVVQFACYCDTVTLAITTSPISYFHTTTPNSRDMEGLGCAGEGGGEWSVSWTISTLAHQTVGMGVDRRGWSEKGGGGRYGGLFPHQHAEQSGWGGGGGVFSLPLGTSVSEPWRQDPSAVYLLEARPICSLIPRGRTHLQSASWRQDSSAVYLLEAGPICSLTHGGRTHLQSASWMQGPSAVYLLEAGSICSLTPGGRTHLQSASWKQGPSAVYLLVSL